MSMTPTKKEFDDLVTKSVKRMLQVSPEMDLEQANFFARAATSQLLSSGQAGESMHTAFNKFTDYTSAES